MFGIGFFEAVIVLILAFGFILWIWALLDCLQNEPSKGNEKLVWILVILLASFVGALLYLIVRRPKRIEQLGK